MKDWTDQPDVLVVGGGNAALCAAIAARRNGAEVLVVEAAPKFYRGGNTRHTRNMRCAHDTATGHLTGPYTEAEFWDDLAAGDRGPYRRRPRPLHDRAIEGDAGLDCRAGRAVPALARRHAQPGADQFLLSRRRAGHAQHALPHRRRPGRARALRRAGDRARHRGRHLPLCHRPDRRQAGGRPRQGAGRRRGRVRGQYRLAEGMLGRAGGELPDPRHALQPGRRPADAARPGASSRSAIRPSAMPWPSTRARRNSTAASSPGSTASSSASW